ncbi:MAG TPA: alpha-glucosidase/alpha-galactosidase [Candidatus Limnocylindrales bacterium]|nr:alpha-glucosidase/alpha-galactosidase [Candidatus Limnocylindrales bacterium]
MTRIALVGAGSVEFTRNLLGDFLSYPELQDAEIVLHDIDADRLATARRMADWTAGALGASPRFEASLDRREALRGADFVVNTIQVGGARATQLDFEIPGRYGLQYTINDTINVGGVFRGLRTIPVVLGIVRDIEDVAPDAVFLNYTNPMSMLVWAVAARSRIPTVGLCHSVYWTVRSLAEYVGVPWEEVVTDTAGVNHLAFVTRIEHAGRDLYPAIDAAVRESRIPDDDLVRAELYRRLGFWPTESSEHHAEYNPWFIGKGDAVERFRIPIGEYLRRVAANLDEYADTKRRLDAGDPFELERSGEYAAVIVHSMTTGEPSRIVANVMNDGLIPNLSGDACVEVPARVDAAGVHPIPADPLPLQCAAYIHPAIDAQALTVHAAFEEDRAAVYHAVLQDPLVAARLSLDEAWQLTDELIEAEAEWLPSWLGGRATAEPIPTT